MILRIILLKIKGNVHKTLNKPLSFAIKADNYQLFYFEFFSMALGVYQAINPIGGVISPFVINPLTKIFSNVKINAFVISGFLALLIGLIVLFSNYQKI